MYLTLLGVRLKTIKGQPVLIFQPRRCEAPWFFFTLVFVLSPCPSPKIGEGEMMNHDIQTAFNLL